MVLSSFIVTEKKILLASLVHAVILSLSATLHLAGPILSA